MKTMKMDTIRLAQRLEQVIFAYAASSEKGVLIKETTLSHTFQEFLKPQMQSIKFC